MQIPCDAIAVGEDLQLLHPALRTGQLPRQRGLVGERGGHFRLFGRERAATVRAHGHQHSGDRIGGPKRYHEGGPGLACDGVERVEAPWRALQEGRADRCAADRDGRAFEDGWQFARGLDDHQVLDAIRRQLGVERYGDQSALCAGEFQCLVGDEPKYGGRIGAGEHLRSDVARRGDPRLAVTRLRVEPSIVDRDARGGRPAPRRAPRRPR